MLEQGEVVQLPIPERQPREASIMARYLLAGVALLGTAYGVASVRTGMTYGVDEASTLLEQNGYTHPNYVDTDRVFVSFKGCDTLDEIKLDFEATNANGQVVKASVCAGLGKTAHLAHK